MLLDSDYPLITICYQHASARWSDLTIYQLVWHDRLESVFPLPLLLMRCGTDVTLIILPLAKSFKILPGTVFLRSASCVRAESALAILASQRKSKPVRSKPVL